MEANCASIWSEESETIAHLQSMFWSGSNADACLSSPNSSASSCVEPSTSPTALFLPLAENQRCDKEQCQNTGAVRCFGHKSQVLAPITNEVTANKRVCLMDENRKSTDAKRPCTVPPWVSRKNSIAPADEINTTEPVNKSCSWCCSSEDDSAGACEEPIVLKQSTSSRGPSRSSKDSQSLYAKRRRERINEKLRTLQQLIPNGTKVDMSTMLEEAVQYVKFLQLQIKLLSSEETWMYAPLAYTHLGPNVAVNQP
ncbi:transcription factor bHLH139 [Zea mays]|uniref:BHLH domain-containing protein n=2 Tax=Zea mays TaxID=4577 RepID=A0A804NK16_MAIZE|nr:transcription factor bHLH139 [Zea mays]|eukprot:XP_008677952.1 transcription factor bHLH139 [Zea mays]